MDRKFGKSWLVATFALGFVLGGLSAALFVTTKHANYEAEAITLAIADSAFGLVPMVAALKEDDRNRQIELLASYAQKQLTAGIIVMDYNLPVLSEHRKESVTDVLRSIARSREQLGLGKYATPPRDDIEAILVAYAD